MNNFQFHNTTKIIFGKGTELQIAEEIKPFTHKVLLHYGGGSIKKIVTIQRTNLTRENPVVFPRTNSPKHDWKRPHAYGR